MMTFVPGSTRLNEEWHGICEYLSRGARTKLVELLLEELGSTAELAKKIGVTEGAVRKWLNSTHPSNSNLELLLKLTLAINKEPSLEILKEDLRTHRASLAALLWWINHRTRARSARASP